jgi:hypothetical protein
LVSQTIVTEVQPLDIRHIRKALCELDGFLVAKTTPLKVDDGVRSRSDHHRKRKKLSANHIVEVLLTCCVQLRLILFTTLVPLLCKALKCSKEGVPCRIAEITANVASLFGK